MMTVVKVMSVSQLCVYANCSKSTIYRAIAAGLLKARKNGRSTIVLIEDADAWLESLPDCKADNDDADDEAA